MKDLKICKCVFLQYKAIEDGSPILQFFLD